MEKASLSKIHVEVEGGAPGGAESKGDEGPPATASISVQVVTDALAPVLDLARRFADQERERIEMGDVRNWPKDRLHAFIGDDRYGLPDDAKAALCKGLTSGRNLLTGQLSKAPEKALAELGSLLGAKSLGAEAWEEALAASGAAKLGNLADLGPGDAKEAFLDEDVVELEDNPEQWLAALEEDWEIAGLDAESARKIKAKIEEIEAEALSKAKELLPAVERLASDAKGGQKAFSDGQNAMERACGLLPDLWPLLADGKLQKGIGEIEKVIDRAAAAEAKKAALSSPAAHGSSYEADVLEDLKPGGRTSYAMDEELQEQARQEEEKKEKDAPEGRYGQTLDVDPQGAEAAKNGDEAQKKKDEEGESKADKAPPPAVAIIGPVDKILSEIVIKNTTTSFEAAPAPETAVRDWGEDYRQLSEMAEDDDAKRKAKFQLVSEISQNFINDVAIVGKRIIEEIFIKEYRRISFKPIGMGGIAGGRKYIVNGILYKLASAAEEGSPYENSFEAANKAAAHDLRGATAISNAAEAIKKREPGKEMPHVTLNALVDYLGFRLQAMPTLPLESGSLKLGSGDAGDSVKNEDEKLTAMFEEVAAELGMALHHILQSADKAEKQKCEAKLVELEKKNKGGTDTAVINDLKAELAAFDDKEVTTPFGLDVEGHRDREGRPVALDFARVFSPEHIRETKHLSMKTPGTIFVRHLRPELIKKFASSKDGAPLSADALSMFASGASDGPEMNERVKKATKWLLEDAIPKAAKELDQAFPIKRGADISPFLHERGINVRHMGLVYHHCANDEVRTAFLAEMVARTIKNLMRHAAREAVQRWRRADIAGVRKLYTELLNLVFQMSASTDDAKGNDDALQRFWQADIWDGLRRRYGDRSDDMRGRLRGKVLPNLGAVKQMVWRLADMLGLAFSDDCREALKEDPALDEKADQGFFFFTSTDIQALDVRVKYMTVVDRAAGKVLAIEKADRRGAQDAAVSTRLAKAAKQRFEAVLRSTPGDTEATESIKKLSKLTHVKDVMDRLIGFNEETRKSEGLIQMRDEQERWESGEITVIDLRDAPTGTHPDICEWWRDLLDLVLHDGKFEQVKHLRVRESEGKSFALPGLFDYDKDEGKFPVDLLRSNAEECIAVEELKVGNASGFRLFHELARHWKKESAGPNGKQVVVKKLTGFRALSLFGSESRDNSMAGPEDWLFKTLSESLASTTEVDLSKSKFEGDLSKVQWPAALQNLNLSDCGKVQAVKWPAALQTLDLSYCYRIEAVKWPEGLRYLRLYRTGVSGDLSKVQWPGGLLTLDLGQSNVSGKDGDLRKKDCDKLRSWIAKNHPHRQAAAGAEGNKKPGFFGKMFHKKNS
eukprot:g549.t1